MFSPKGPQGPAFCYESAPLAPSQALPQREHEVSSSPTYAMALTLTPVQHQSPRSVGLYPPLTVP